jgi:signal transduction histidine kinase
VADDGIGSGPPAPHGEPGHLGLLSMRERTESLGGVFTAISSPGEGTRINVLVPLSA